ncbi:MAG: hypothetical protein HKP53_08890 [Eudoraea sp.]|nr:hypothetical protein [Eudoraea sp.]
MKKTLILNALIWAAVIITTSYILEDPEKSQTIIGIMAVAFALQNGFTYAFLKDKN